MEGFPQKATQAEVKKAEEMMTPKQRKLTEKREDRHKRFEKAGMMGDLVYHRDGSGLEGNEHEVYEIQGIINGKKVLFERLARKQSDGIWVNKDTGTVDGQLLTPEDTVLALRKCIQIMGSISEDYEWDLSDAMDEVKHEAREYAEASKRSAELLKSIGI